MLCETDIKVSWRARPRGFVALMSLYESNYLRFMQWAGDPARLSGTLISRVEGDCELQLAVLEHMPYTSMLTLTYAMPAAQGAMEWLPNLKLRAYHDARLLEADEFRRPRAAARSSQPQENNNKNNKENNNHRRGPHPGERELHQRWTRNMMLNKWLEYCA